MSYTQSSLNIKDAGGTSRLVNAYTDGTQFNFVHGLIDGLGALVTTSNGLPVNIAQVGASALALGQALAAASIPVVLTAAQMTTLTPLTTLPTVTTVGAVTAITNALPAGSALLGAISSQPLITASGTMTRPADTTAYAFGDLVANSTTAASVTNITITSCARGTDIPGRITGALLTKSGTTTTNAIFRAHLFNVNPVASAPTNGDNGVFAPALKAGYLGYIDFSLTPFAFGDGVTQRGTVNIGPYINFKPVSGTSNLFALLEARAVYTPANAEVFTLTLEVE